MLAGKLVRFSPRFNLTLVPRSIEGVGDTVEIDGIEYNIRSPMMRSKESPDTKKGVLRESLTNVFSYIGDLFATPITTFGEDTDQAYSRLHQLLTDGIRNHLYAFNGGKDIIEVVLPATEIQLPVEDDLDTDAALDLDSYENVLNIPIATFLDFSVSPTIQLMPVEGTNTVQEIIININVVSVVPGLVDTDGKPTRLLQGMQKLIATFSKSVNIPCEVALMVYAEDLTNPDVMSWFNEAAEIIGNNTVVEQGVDSPFYTASTFGGDIYLRYEGLIAETVK